MTHKVNVLRGSGPAAVNATKTHCPHRHPYSPENTKVDLLGRRVCQTCRRQWVAKSNANR